MNKVARSLSFLLSIFSLQSVSAESQPREQAEIYAIVQPAVYYYGIQEADLANILIEAYYFFRYESVCYYTLGCMPKFYRSLEAAKSHFGDEISKDKLNIIRQRKSQKAIVELKVDKPKLNIVAFNKIYTIRKFKKVTRVIDKDLGPSEYREFYRPQWETKKITDSDLSSGALAEIDRLYKAKD